MRTKSDILNTTEPATQQPEESNWLWNGGWIGIIFCIIVIVIASRSVCDILERTRQRLRNRSCSGTLSLVTVVSVRQGLGAVWKQLQVYSVDARRLIVTQEIQAPRRHLLFLYRGCPS